MDLHTRIKMANVERARALREIREAEMTKLYATGYKLGIKGHTPSSCLWDAAQMTLGIAGAMGVLYLVVQSLLS